MRRPTVAAGFARGLLDLAVAKGADRQTLAHASGIDLELLEDPDNRVNLANYVRLMRAAQAQTGDAALALHFGEAIDIEEMSIVGLMALGCETAADAFAQMGRYTRLMSDVELEGEASTRHMLTREPGRICLVDTRKDPNAFPELTETGFARLVTRGRTMPGEMTYLREVHVTHPAPAYRAEYDRIFRVPVVFDSERNALVLSEDDSWLTQRIARQPRYVFGVLSQRAEALLEELEGATSTRGRVESVLMRSLHTGDTSMERVAVELGLSRPTLFRRLRAEGVTFQKILDDLRRHMALSYLDGKKVSVNETAFLVGFSEPAAFSRAFKRWTGASPREMQKQSIA
jgi:AraC-like DNA-binding protein